MGALARSYWIHRPAYVAELVILAHYSAVYFSLDSGRQATYMAKRQPSNPDRVRVWNSFFHQARAEARRLNASEVPLGGFDPEGGRLTDEQQTVLAVLALCTLAIEARTNHLIIELAEKGRLSQVESEAAQRLPPLEKWVLLPRLAGRKGRVQTDRSPHQAVAEICNRRNALVHVHFDKLTTQLPDKARMLRLFSGFVEAMEDMNVLLGRASRPRKRVLRLGHV